MTTSAVLGEGERRGEANRELIARCARGERAALAELYRRYQARVFNLVTRMVGREEAEELTQDAFLRIFRGIGSFRGDAALGTWIYRLSMNVCLSYLAKRSRRRRLQERYEAQLAQTAELTARRSEPEPMLRRRLELAIKVLPPGYRAVLVLHDVEGLNHQEIAQILGCREGTSKSQLHKARLRMRDLLGPALRREREARR